MIDETSFDVRQLHRQGYCIGLTLPKEILPNVKLRAGDVVEVLLNNKNGDIILRKPMEATQTNDPDP